VNIRIEYSKLICILHLQGDLDLFSAELLKRQFQLQFNRGLKQLILDMQQVEYIDSMGIGSLLYIFSETKKRNISLHIVGVHGTPRKVIELTRLDRYFPLAESLQEVLDEFDEDGGHEDEWS